MALAAILLAAWLPASPAARAEAALEVRITGVSDAVRDNVEAAVSLNRRRNESLSETLLRELHGMAEAEIRRALEPFGYYQPKIDSTLLPPGPGAPTWVASYRIEPGAPVPVTRLNIAALGAGASDPELGAVIAALPLAEGQPLNHLDYERAKRELLTLAHQAGYVDASYRKHAVEVDLASYSAAIDLVLDTGPLYVVGPISFVQDQFADAYLRRYLVLEPGAPLRQADLTQQRRLLSRSGHFQEVLIEEGEPDPAAPHAVPLTIALTPFKANRYRGQLGWGTDTGLGIQADWNRRYIGPWGHRFSLGATAVEDQERLAGDFRYSIPWDPLTGERLEFAARHQGRTIGFDDVELDEGGETRVVNNLLSAFWYFPFASLGEFQLSSRAGLSVVTDSYDIFEVLFGNLPADAQQAIIGAIGEEAFTTLTPEFEALVPSVRLTARRSDDRLFIRNGDFFNLELLGTSESLGSNIDFWQARFNSWTIRPIGSRGRLLLRTAAGTTDAETETVFGVEFNQMPEYFEFRAGGARSVRGYRFEELFPDSVITGAKHQLIGSVEYEHELFSGLSLAGFVDVGNAFNDFDNIDEKYGVGLGVRYRSPVGVARFDLAFPLDESEESFQIYITVGPEF